MRLFNLAQRGGEIKIFKSDGKTLLKSFVQKKNQKVCGLALKKSLLKNAKPYNMNK